MGIRKVSALTGLLVSLLPLGSTGRSTAAAEAPGLNVWPRIVDFGPVQIHRRRQMRVHLANTSEFVIRVAIYQPEPPYFVPSHPTRNPRPRRLSINPGQHRTISLLFRPQAVAVFGDKVVVRVEGGVESVHTVLLTGAGISGPGPPR